MVCERFSVVSARKCSRFARISPTQVANSIQGERMMALSDPAKELLDFIYAQPLHREIYYRVLSFCKDRRSLPEVEEFIMQIPEYRRATQSPFFLIDDLHEKGALAMIELTEDGHEISPEDKEGLDEDEVDDLIASFAYEATKLGIEAAEACTPNARLELLLENYPADREAIQEVMGFLQTKKGIGSIEMMLQQWLNEDDHRLELPISSIVDKLEKTGIIRWDSGWELTEEGRGLLGKKKE